MSSQSKYALFVFSALLSVASVNFSTAQDFPDARVRQPRGITTVNPDASGRSPASARGRTHHDSKTLTPSQGERMLRDPAARQPGFIRELPSRSHWVGVCRTSIGGYSVSAQDRRGYERCLEDRGIYTARGAGMLFPVR